MLHRNYAGAALEFFKVARSRSGYGPGTEQLRARADRANDPDLATPEASEEWRRKVGEEGEKHANKHLCEKFGSRKVKWVSGIGGKQHKGGEPKGVDDNCGYDFECIDAEGEKHYFEVKATSVDEPKFHLGSSQIRAALKYGSQWHILRVLMRVWDSPKFNCLPNPFEDDSKVRLWCEIKIQE